MSELNLIDHITAHQARLPEGAVGIGDDAAVIEAGNGWVIATDMILDKRHFDTAVHPPHLIGRKALAVNLSDMAAMGATPRYALVSVAIPAEFGSDNVVDLWHGLQLLADEFNTIIIGGDTNAGTQSLVLNVTILGSPFPNGSALRSGAQPGDDLYVTGPLGGSQRENHHLSFRPKVREALQLMANVQPTSMIDVSDGVATDLAHICRASSAGAELSSILLPISSRVDEALPNSQRLIHALTDGEDFELLFSLSPSKRRNLDTLDFSCHRIGSISAQSGIRLDGKPLALTGFEHRF